jgi:glucosamine--fructose-6-phosphate aminotransferase (isomerizing)
MPATVPGITFDEIGICVFCRNYRPYVPLGRQALDELVVKVKKLRRPFDAIVPLSGGRDSAYVLYLAKRELALNVLAVNYDSEFRTEQAVLNMENACRMLNVKLISIRSKKDLASQFVRNTVRAAASPREFNVCGPCGYGNKAIVWSIAHRNNVPLILWGSASVESTPGMINTIWPHLKRSKSRFRIIIKPSFVLAEIEAVRHRMEFPLPGHSPFSRKPASIGDPEITLVSVFDYIQWEREKIKRTIQEELGWKKPDDHVSTWRIDCKLDRLINFEFFKLFGCSKHCFGYTQMINSGQMSREEALAQEEVMAATYMDGMREYLIDVIGLSAKQADRIMAF